MVFHVSCIEEEMLRIDMWIGYGVGRAGMEISVCTDSIERALVLIIILNT